MSVIAPLLPIPLVYRVLEMHAMTAALLRDVEDSAFLVRHSWEDPVNEDEVVVTYAEYSASWGGGEADPFIVDWSEVDMTELGAVAYVAAVLNSLSVDVAVWTNSGVIRGEVYSSVIHFLGVLEELFEHCSSVKTIRTTHLSNILAPAA